VLRQVTNKQKGRFSAAFIVPRAVFTALQPLAWACSAGAGSGRCPHCGALYSITYRKLSKSDSDAAKCVVCGKIMDKSDSTNLRIFKLVHRPEDA
jgi:uncharacterized protein (DUF983 family)